MLFVELVRPLFLLRGFLLAASLESNNVAFKKHLSYRYFLASQFSCVDQVVDILARNLEIFHGIAHAHEFWREFVHSVIGLTYNAIVDVVL